MYCLFSETFCTTAIKVATRMILRRQFFGKAKSSLQNKQWADFKSKKDDCKARCGRARMWNWSILAGTSMVSVFIPRKPPSVLQETFFVGYHLLTHSKIIFLFSHITL